VRKDAVGSDPAARDDAAAQRDHRGDLPDRKIDIAELVAGIDDLDPDRA